MVILEKQKMIKPATLVTARRRVEIYPESVHYLGYDSDNNFIDFFAWCNKQNKLIAVSAEDERVTPEKIVESLSDLIQERNELRKQLEQVPQQAVITSPSMFMCSFKLRGEQEYVYGLTSKDSAQRTVQANIDVYGERSVTDVSIREYAIEWKS